MTSRLERLTFIEPAAAWSRVDLAELWRYRQLLFFLVWRDIKVRYSQTLLGVGWAVLQPVLAALVFTIIFGRFAGVPSDGTPYPVFVLTALVPWTYFANAFGGAGNSLVESSGLITKVYFPRLLIPLTPVVAGLVDFTSALAILLIVMAWFGVMPPVTVLLLPVLVLVMMVTAAGTGCWLAALNIQFRDVRYAIPFLAQLWMFATPIIYPMSLVPQRYQPFYALNPMAGVIESFRAVLLGTGSIPVAVLGISLISGLALFLSGVLYFVRLERSFADIA
jgi:lipopolysaccharide transport system permease protein